MANIRVLAYAGHPTSGTGNVNDIAVDSTGAVWRCTTDGTPGTWVSEASGTINGGIATSPPTVSTPAVPATTVAVTNATGVDCVVYLAGGTVTAVKVGATTTGLLAGSIYLPAGHTITLTYSVAPTWVWMGV